MIEASAQPANRTRTLAEAIAIMARLRAPGGCPWDREQTFDSIKRYTLEETYEVFDAIDRRAWTDLKDELGDLLLQVLFYAQMAEEEGLFSIEDVAANLNAKLIRRHPHVFGDALAATPADVNARWESIKQQEKAARGREELAGWLDPVPQHLPAVLEAFQLGQRAAKVGFDWTDTTGLLEKLAEESDELRVEVDRMAEAPGSAEVKAAVADELGDLLFTAVNLARHLKLEPEFVLRASNRKFRTRFQRMEVLAGGSAALGAATPEVLDRLWRTAKEQMNGVPVSGSAAASAAVPGSLPDNSSPEPR